MRIRTKKDRRERIRLRQRLRTARARGQVARQVGLAFAAQVERRRLAGIEAQQAARRKHARERQVHEAVNLGPPVRLTACETLPILADLHARQLAPAARRAVLAYRAGRNEFS